VFLYSFFKVSFYAAMICKFICLGIGMISELNEYLAAISRWSAEKGLLLYPRNLQAILISNSAVGMVLLSFFLGTEEIPWCDAVNDLWWSSMVVFVLIVRLRRCVRGFMPYCKHCVC
jgi:hypothetical protein